MSERVELPRAERCETCRFWESQGENGNRDRYGLCRRYPPQLFSVTKDEFYDSSDPNLYAEFPPTVANEWCGEWQAKHPKPDNTAIDFLFTRVIDLKIGHGNREAKKLAAALNDEYNAHDYGQKKLTTEDWYVRDLIHMTAERISRIKGIGENTVQELRQVLAVRGFFLKGDYPTLAPHPPAG